MSYMPPTIPFDVTWEGASDYVAPTSPVDATWQSGEVTAQIRVVGPRGRASMLAEVSAPLLVAGTISMRGPRGRIAARANLVVQGRASATGPRGRITARGVAVARGTARVAGPRGRILAHATVVRFDLRGIVRNQGVLVERRVRAYDRVTGALVGEADTAGGVFAIHTGFEPGEYVVLPIDMSESATDYAPPAANRVLSMLAQDVP